MGVVVITGCAYEACSVNDPVMIGSVSGKQRVAFSDNNPSSAHR